jgi:hypothetical protein
MNVTIIPADRRHFMDVGWLQTYWLFSFSNHCNPANMGHANCGFHGTPKGERHNPPMTCTLEKGEIQCRI